MKNFKSFVRYAQAQSNNLAKEKKK